jgi:hypothetical protein
MTACAALLAASGIASALTTGTVVYGTDGYVVSAVDGPGYPAGTCVAYGQAVGTHSTAQVYAVPAGSPGFTLVTNGTSATATTTDSSLAYSCTSGTAMPTTLAGATLSLACYANTVAGAGTSAVIGIVEKFAVTKTGQNGLNVASTTDVETTSTFLGAGFSTACTTITDSTWIKE